MTYQKHTTHTDALDTLGSIIGVNEARDAIHVAVEPVYAAEHLLPGQWVTVDKDGFARVADKDQAIGIVDPFLGHAVQAGQRFWLLIKPRTITSLRHVWVHPDLPGADVPEPLAMALVVNEALAKEASEQWLRSWVADQDLPDFYLVIEAAIGQRDSDSVWLGTDGNAIIPAEFWAHLKIWKGVDAGPNPPTYFRCSC